MKLELNLPWKPILAWPWGVKYEIDPDSYLVTSHVESWDVEPWEVSFDTVQMINYCRAVVSFNQLTIVQGVKQIFRKPNVKISQ